MSFAAGMARDMVLVARNSDLQFEINLLSENDMQLQTVASQLISLGVSLATNSPQAQLLQARQAQIALLSKGIEMRLELVKSQQKAVQTELDAVQKTISDDINRSFKTFANA